MVLMLVCFVYRVWHQQVVCLVISLLGRWEKFAPHSTPPPTLRELLSNPNRHKTKVLSLEKLFRAAHTSVVLLDTPTISFCHTTGFSFPPLGH